MKPPFADLRAFRRNPLSLLANRAHQNEPGFVNLYLGMRPAVMVTEPKIARQILRWDTSEIDKGRLVQTIRPLVGDSLLVNIGDAHKRSKNRIHRHLQRNTLAKYLPPMIAIIDRFAAELAQRPQFITTEKTPLLSLRLGCAAFFGSSILSDEDQRALVQAVQTVEAEIADEMFSPFAGAPWNTAARKRRISEAREIVTHILKRIRRSGERGALLTSMEDSDLTEEEIVSEFLGLFIAGHHSTGATFGWMMRQLALDPSIGDMLSLEADECLSDLERGDITALKRAPFSEAFAKEVMRLYPGGWWTSREALVDIEVEGHSFRRGTVFIVSPWAFHRDKRYWEAPEAIDLGRDFTSPAYMPFGAGPRACIGMNVALIELQLFALQISTTFNFEFIGAPNGPNPVPRIALLAPPFQMRTTVKMKRSHTKCVA